MMIYFYKSIQGADYFIYLCFHEYLAFSHFAGIPIP